MGSFEPVIYGRYSDVESPKARVCQGEPPVSIAPETSCAHQARRWFEEVWGQRKTEVVDELLNAESVCYSEQGPVIGPEEFKQKMYFPMLKAFPDLQVFIDDVLECSGQVVVRWRAEGTHSSDALGFPATGRAVKFDGITWVRVKDGRFTEGWQSSNIPMVLTELSAS